MTAWRMSCSVDDHGKSALETEPLLQGDHPEWVGVAVKENVWIPGVATVRA